MIEKKPSSAVTLVVQMSRQTVSSLSDEDRFPPVPTTFFELDGG